MVIYFRGMLKEEFVEFIMFMVKLGKMVDLSSIEGIKVDKYLSGGIVDIIILVLILLVVFCGVKVVKMLGCGFFYIGGIIDKLELILGFKIEFLEDEFV